VILNFERERGIRLVRIYYLLYLGGIRVYPCESHPHLFSFSNYLEIKNRKMSFLLLTNGVRQVGIDVMSINEVYLLRERK
jgi:hypothetical protein